MNIRHLLALFAGCGAALFASAAVITGNVSNANGEPIIGANIKLLNLPDSVFVGGASSDYDGNFAIDSVRTGSYALIAQSDGIESAPMTLRLTDDSDSIKVPAIVLKDKTTRLEDLVVTAIKSAIIAKEDTIEYNAGSYKTGQNAVVEDLLKKLPGVEVSSDGSITSGGKTISKILVDGEEFFTDDPKMASKNLPATMVDKVQVVDRKSDLARLTGIDDGEEQTVINLTIKKGMKNGWFGNALAGYGTDNRYNAGFNVNYFKDKNQVTLLGGINNVNDMTFTDTGRGRFRDFGFAGNGGINTSRSLGVNFAVGNSEKFRLGGNVLFTNSMQDFQSTSETRFIYPDYDNFQSSKSNSLAKSYNLRADFRMQWNIDENNTIDFRPRFSFNSRNADKITGETLKNDDEALINSQDNMQRGDGSGWQTSADLIYSHKFAEKPGRSISVQGKYDFSNTLENSTSWSAIKYYLQGDSEDLLRYLESRQWSNGASARLTWVEPLGDVANGNFLNFAYNIQYKWNNAKRTTYNFNPDELDETMTEDLFNSLTLNPSDGTEDLSLSNDFRNDYFSQDLQASYKKVHKLYNLEAGLVFSPSMSKSIDLINPDRNIAARWVYNVAPFLRFRYNFSKQRNLNVNYRARTSAPSLTQLQPVADESDPLHITVGNPNLKPTFTQSLMARYYDYNTDTQRLFTTMFNVRHTLNDIVSYAVTNPVTGVQTTTYRNVNNGFSVMGMAMFNRQIPHSHFRLSADLMLNYSSSPGYIDGDLNRAGNLNVRPTLSATYSIDILQISLRPQYSLQYTHNSLPGQRSRTVHSFGFFGDAALTLDNGLEIYTDIDWTKTSGYASGFNSSQWLWNAQISYSFLKNRSLTVALKVYDILQQKRNISRNVTALSISDRWVNGLTRYAMVTLTYTFRTFTTPTTDFGPDGPGGPDGPRPPLPPGGGPGPGGPPRF